MHTSVKVGTNKKYEGHNKNQMTHFTINCGMFPDNPGLQRKALCARKETDRKSILMETE